MSQPPVTKVAAAIATHKREKELARLLAALAASETRLDPVCVADNASAEATGRVCAEAGARWLPRPVNNGPGAAWNAAVKDALRDPAVTHVLVLDDDVIPPPAAVETMLSAMETARCGAVAPLLFDAEGRLWGFPEPRAPDLRREIRRVGDAGSAAKILGGEPHRFCWATGACMLYRRDAFEKCGFFREDFWMLGEDLEFSMRAAAAVGGAFTARVAVPHLPPEPSDLRAARTANRAKFLALLQNLSFLAFHAPRREHLRSYLPGNFRRYLRTEGWNAGNAWDAWCAFWQGSVGAQPAGTPAGARLRERARRRVAGDNPE